MKLILGALLDRQRGIRVRKTETRLSRHHPHRRIGRVRVLVLLEGAVARMPKSRAVPPTPALLTPMRWQPLHVFPATSTLYAFHAAKSEPTKEYGWS